jgi:hypothetical protein
MSKFKVQMSKGNPNVKVQMSKGERKPVALGSG